MKNKITICLPAIFMWLSTLASPKTISGNAVEGALKKLDNEIEQRETYKRQREIGIDSLKQLRAKMTIGDNNWIEATMEIAKSYNSFNNDSALGYYSEGLKFAEMERCDSLIAEFRVRRATYLTISGYIHDALAELAKVDTTGFNNGLWRTYHDATRQMFSFISAYYDGELAMRDYWQNKSIEAQYKLLPLLDKHSVEYKLNLGEYYFSRREYAESKKVLTAMLMTITPDTHAYAIACHILAEIERLSGNSNNCLYYLAQSAITDTRMATLEVTSIQSLGGMLFEMGQTKRAHSYLTTAMANAVDSRASVRISRISELLTIAEQVHRKELAAWRRATNCAIIVMAILLAGLIVAMWSLFRQLKRADTMKQNLEKANKTKDIYINKFLTLSSIYMDKLQQFGKLVNRKISAGQIDELIKMAKSGKIVEEQSKEFYSVFDDAFLHIYPSFVERVNKLLKPEEQIVPAEGELLNSDLRILAFMRLGIDDAQRVAQILNYSVNTIYAYRNKLRNKAINRETFESDIMAIN